jgi:hypothetical protein
MRIGAALGGVRVGVDGGGGQARHGVDEGVLGVDRYGVGLGHGQPRIADGGEDRLDGVGGP